MNLQKATKAPDFIQKSTPKKKKTKNPLAVAGSITGNYTPFNQPNSLITNGNTTITSTTTANVSLMGGGTTANVSLMGGGTTVTLTPGIYHGTTTWPKYQSRVAVLGGEFDLLSQVDLAVVMSLVGFLGIGYYVHLKDCGFDISGLPKDLVDHLDTLAAQHHRGERIKNVLGSDGEA
jgi:hypothetical protein